MEIINAKKIVQVTAAFLVVAAAVFGIALMLIERMDNRLDAMESRLKAEIAASETRLNAEITEVETELSEDIADVEKRLSDDILMTREEIAEIRKDIKDIGSRIEDVERSQYKLDGAFDILNQQLGADNP